MIATNGNIHLPVSGKMKSIQETEITINQNYAFPVSSENNLPTLQEWMHKAEEDLREKKSHTITITKLIEKQLDTFFLTVVNSCRLYIHVQL